MKIVMTLLVRDEEDVIRENLEFHRMQGVDFFVVMDNLSTDRTAEIVSEYVDAGLACYLFQAQDDYQQSAWVTEMAQRAFVEYGADWVINNDADEFWWPLQGTLRTTLAGIAPEVRAFVAQRHNFVPTGGLSSPDPFYKRMTYRHAVSRNAEGQPLPPKMAHRGSADVVVFQGNHAIAGVGSEQIEHGLCEILHFPLRRYLQLANKIAKGGAAYGRNSVVPQFVGRAWRGLYETYKVNKNLLDYYMSEHFDDKQIAAALAQGEIVEDFRLKHFLDGPRESTVSDQARISNSLITASVRRA